MRRVELLIEETRAMTGNERADSDSGVSQYQMVRVLKNAQDQLFKTIINVKSKVLTKEEQVPVVSGQELYSYPFDLYLQNIETMQWSQNPGSQGLDWINLYQGITKDRQSSVNGYPFSYIPRGDGFLLNPPVNNGFLRLTYQRVIPALEKRSGKVQAVTLSGLSLSALTIDPAEASFDQTYLNKVQTLCVVDRYGRIKARNIEFTSVDGSGVFTLATQDLPSGSSITTDDYVVAGRYAANVSELPDICESYILKHAIYETRYGDYSGWTKAALDDLMMCMTSIIESFARPTNDIIDIPVTNVDYLDIF